MICGLSNQGRTLGPDFKTCPGLGDIGHDMREIFPRPRFGECREAVYGSLEASSTDADQAPLLHSGEGESLSHRTQRIETGSGHILWSQLGCYSRLATPTEIESILETIALILNVSLHCSDNERAEPDVRHGLSAQDASLSVLRLRSGYVPPMFSVLLPPPRVLCEGKLASPRRPRAKHSQERNRTDKGFVKSQGPVQRQALRNRTKKETEKDLLLPPLILILPTIRPRLEF